MEKSKTHIEMRLFLDFATQMAPLSRDEEKNARQKLLFSSVSFGQLKRKELQREKEEEFENDFWCSRPTLKDLVSIFGI